MLDQNTDRMWFVIGAVLIGAGLIAAANIFFPEVFASIKGSFTGMMDKAAEGLDTVEFNPGPGTPTDPVTPTINLLKGLF